MVTPPPMFHWPLIGVGYVVGQGARCGSWGAPAADGLGQLGHADGGDQHDDPRGVEQPPDHGQLDHRARQRPDGEGGHQGQPVGPVVDARP